MNAIKGLMVLITMFSTTAFAQYSSYNSAEISGKLGMTAGAFNFGVDYVQPKGDYGFGGYLFMQMAKDQNTTTLVSGVTALGAMVKLVLVEKSSIKAYVAPGVGIAMIKDGSVNAFGRKSDETVIGTTFKMGVQFVKSQGFSIGLERMQFSNWLNDSLNNFSGPSEYYSVIGTWLY